MNYLLCVSSDECMWLVITKGKSSHFSCDSHEGEALRTFFRMKIFLQEAADQSIELQEISLGPF